MRDVIYGLTLGITCNSLMQFKTSFSHRQTPFKYKKDKSLQTVFNCTVVFGRLADI